MLLETPGIHQELSAPRKGPCPVTKDYKNGAIQIQKAAVLERINIRRICRVQATSGFILPWERMTCLN
jgi:hypothetical protein